MVASSSTMPQFRTLDQADVANKRVLLRVDLNVPMEGGRVSDATRIERIVPTITELTNKHAKVILLSHLGRPKGPDPNESQRPAAATRSDRGPAVARHETPGPRWQ